MIRVAYYGKGGIGKSTIAANVTAYLGKKGKKVLHIGCDPKADSTRSLALEPVQPILDKLKTGRDLDNILSKGKFGSYLVECGGPHAGVGCAGLGISTAFEILDDLGVFDMNWDVIVYDVLGDVVCGGFAVPLKESYVDQVNIVSSSDYMSLYAANNIIKAIEYYRSEENPLFSRLILNRINSKLDTDIVEKFSNKTQYLEVYNIYNDANLQKLDFFSKVIVEDDLNNINLSNIDKLSKDILENRNLSTPKSINLDSLDEIRSIIYGM